MTKQFKTEEVSTSKVVFMSDGALETRTQLLGPYLRNLVTISASLVLGLAQSLYGLKNGKTRYI